MKYLKIYTIVACLLLLLVTGSSVFSQSVSATADREKILLGEQIKLLLKSESVNDIISWFSVPDSLNHMEVVERSKIDTIEIEGIRNYEQTITITSFDSGQWQIPALQIATSKAIYKTQPITIEVLPVDVSQLEEYHDIKDIVEVEAPRSWLIIIIIAAITLLSALGIWYYLNKHKKPQVAAPKISGNLTPLQWAEKELDTLAQENYVAQNKVKKHYQQLTNICRQYFYLQLQHKSLYETTGEWMLHLQPLPVQQEIKTSFLQLLILADTVKFAKYLPPQEENDNSINTARQMVKQVAAWQNTIVKSPKKSN